MRWAADDLDRGLLFVEGDPKTAAGRRAVTLDKHTVAILRKHRRRQLEQRDRRRAADKAWIDSGYVFTRKDGLPINPNYATTRFRKLTERAGLPPVRLHDLRHGAASLAHEAGADLKTLQDLLGQSSIVANRRHLHQRPPGRATSLPPTPPPPWSWPPTGTPANESSRRRRRSGPRRRNK